jgi:putative FmdB family regulatory protein
MPIYEYRCGACGAEKEVLQKISDPPLTQCPACGKPEMVKLVSAAGFQLKGTGWYATDFKHGSRPQKSGSPEGKAGASDAAKSDSAASDSAKADSANPDSAKSESAKSDSAKADSAKSDASGSTSAGSSGASSSR